MQTADRMWALLVAQSDQMWSECVDHVRGADSAQLIKSARDYMHMAHCPKCAANELRKVVQDPAHAALVYHWVALAFFECCNRLKSQQAGEQAESE